MNIPTIPAKTIVSGYSEYGWFGSNYNMNIYKGCCHGCIYCDSRSQCYGVEDFDTVRTKENALSVIERDLKSKRRKGIIITGSMSDAYNPFEKKLELTRGALNLADRYGFGIAVNTKSDLILRDMDILKSIQKHSPVSVGVTITAADDTLCRKIEQHVCSSDMRFSVLKELSSNGIQCGVLLMPILPFINDTEDNIFQIVNKASESGANWIYAGGGFGVTLRQNQRDHFFQKLNTDFADEFPGIRQKYINQYGYQYSCISPNNEKLWELFSSQCDKLGILYRMSDIIRLIKQDYEEEQLSLF